MANNFKNTRAYLVKYGNQVEQEIETRLRNNGKIASGDLACGKGPVLSYAPAVQNNLLKLIINAATKNKIEFQRQAASRSTGTDTDAFAYSTDGIASALISLPLRYMHTTVETVHKNDVEEVIKLIYQHLKGKAN